VGFIDYMEYSYWKYYEKIFYTQNPIFKKTFLSLLQLLEHEFKKNVINNVTSYIIKKNMQKSLKKIEDYVESATKFEYY
jgi:hypothetical protein